MYQAERIRASPSRVIFLENKFMYRLTAFYAFSPILSLFARLIADCECFLAPAKQPTFAPWLKG
jgi:hypothetical protein